MADEDQISTVSTPEQDAARLKAAQQKRRSRFIYGVAAFIGLASLLIYFVKTGHETAAPVSLAEVTPSDGASGNTGSHDVAGQQTPAYATELAQQTKQESAKAAKTATTQPTAYLAPPVDTTAIQSDRGPANTPAPEQTNQSVATTQQSAHIGTTADSQAEAERIATITNALNTVLTDQRPTPQTTMVIQSSAAADTSTPDSGALTTTNTPPVEAKPAPVQPGKVYYAITTTAANSDTPGPVVAVLQAGKSRDAKVLGTFTRLNEKLVVKFSTLVMPDGTTYTISGYAVDPSTQVPAVASNVDTHFFSRWGGLVAASMFSKYGQLLETNGTTSISTVQPGGSSSITTNPQLTPKQMLEASVGSVAQQVQGPAQTNFARPPTVTLASGTGIGVLIMSVQPPTQTTGITGGKG